MRESHLNIAVSLLALSLLCAQAAAEGDESTAEADPCALLADEPAPIEVTSPADFPNDALELAVCVSKLAVRGDCGDLAQLVAFPFQDYAGDPIVDIETWMLRCPGFAGASRLRRCVGFVNEPNREVGLWCTNPGPEEAADPD